MIFSFRQLFRKILFRGQWILLFHFSNTTSTNFSRFLQLVPPKDRFWADPFVLFKNNRYYVFFEELLYKTDKGHISVLEISKDGKALNPVNILEKPYHLSYPFLFEYEDKLYMIPESWEAKTIQLYECIDFPYDWKFKMNLMEGLSAADTTLHFQNDTWWLFATKDKNGKDALDDHLYLFYADNPLTDNWTPHPKNPIVSDKSRARPAGKLFYKNGKLIRPSQDCTKAYGYAFNFNEIKVLTKTEYQEQLLEKIKPDWAPEIKRTHTFNSVEGLTLIDAQINVLRLSTMVHFLK